MSLGSLNSLGSKGLLKQSAACSVCLNMRSQIRYAVLALSLFPCFPLASAQREPWPGSVPEGKLARRLDAIQVQAIISNLNEESNKRFAKEFILKYYLDLGPLNRVHVNPDLWKGITTAERKRLGNDFAKAFRGTGLLYCQFLVEDIAVGKVKSDPIRGGLKFEAVD